MQSKGAEWDEIEDVQGRTGRELTELSANWCKLQHLALAHRLSWIHLLPMMFGKGTEELGTVAAPGCQ